MHKTVDVTYPDGQRKHYEGDLAYSLYFALVDHGPGYFLPPAEGSEIEKLHWRLRTEAEAALGIRLD